MLVLSRKIGEEIVIGDNIRITVADIGNGRVKIGVTAPRDVHVVRAELESQPGILLSEKSETDAFSGLERILANRGKILAPHVATARDRAQENASRLNKPR